MLRVGLTGGIAAGKSRVLKRLGASSFRTIDLDRVAHDVMSPGGAAYADVVDAFGPSILAGDGTIDRKRLGGVVFADEAQRRKLNRLVHPRVREAESALVAAVESQKGTVVVTDAALLVETGVHLRFDRLIVVHCSPAEQLRRLMERDGIDERSARARIDAQMPMEEKVRYGQYLVETSGSLDETDAQVDVLAAQLRAMSVQDREPVTVSPERYERALRESARRAGPRGLTAAAVAERIDRDGGPELSSLASLLDPPTHAPWYRAAHEIKSDGDVEVLLAPVVVWALRRRGNDSVFLCAAAATLSRLVRTDEESAERACRAAQDLAARLAASRG